MNKQALPTSRLTLRLVIETDVDLIHELHLLPETDKFNTLGIPKDKKETKAIVDQWMVNHKKPKPYAYTYVIEKKDDQKFVGLMALTLRNEKFKSGEVWYKLHPKHWRNGYATEALLRLLEFAFVELKLHRIEAGCAVENIGSIRVLEKVGMIREGRKRKVLPLQSGWTDNFIYAILETDSRDKQG
ncbi:GNAT family N-acetyltransferase [Aquimarina sp. U1-2]|uniref:GNAT family N-acetyltransferase n=1 Tax=Aquimarina sp. U1-2 TaxID=2823141 RepID=UPI001AED070D|nr:GNAT family N-acetyltransferase [Aquimarina sp. U1-2]MBP2831560.1 GNAT family N-acetyltransferase [Aquimarina sp. U1-2]